MPDVHNQVTKQQARQKTAHDKQSNSREFFIGQQVMAKNMRPGPTWLPAVIIEKLGPLTYLVEVDGKSWKRHIDHLRIRTDTPSDNPTLECDDVPVPSVTPSLEPPVSRPVIPTSDVEPTESAENTTTEQNIPDNSQDATVPETLPVTRYPSQVRKAPERYHY